MTTDTSDFWYRAARHTHGEEAKDHYNRLARIASKFSYGFHILLFQSPDDSSYYTVAAGNLSQQACKEVKQFFSGSSITLSPRDLAFVRQLVAEQHQRFNRSTSVQGKVARPFKKIGDREEVARTHSSAQADQTFYEKKGHFLRCVEAGTATQAQKAWLKRWGFLEKPKPLLKPTYASPTRTQKAYRYHARMKAVPVSKLEVAGGKGMRRNSYGKIVASPDNERKSVPDKPQTMR
jgi:hypothetical protein